MVGHVGIGLLEASVFATRQGEIGDHGQAVSAASRPSRDDADDDFGHEANESLHFEDVETTALAGVDGLGGLALGVLVAVPTADALITSAAEGPTAVLR